MPCYVCNPQCGRCRPPRRGAEFCPSCGKLTPTEGTDVCTSCGQLLPEPKKLFCEYTKKLCQIPCVRSNEPSDDGQAQECPWGHALDESVDKDFDCVGYAD